MPNFFNPKPLKAANIKNHTVNPCAYICAVHEIAIGKRLACG
jgi:hypothetical protein